MTILVPFLFTLGLNAQAQASPPAKPDPAQAPAARLAVLRTLKVGGDGGWDQVTFDSEARRLYVPRSTRVMVLDPNGKLPIGSTSPPPPSRQPIEVQFKAGEISSRFIH